MKETARNNDKRMSLKEFAKQTGIAYSTAAKYARQFGWTENGKAAELSAVQQTALLEAVKIPSSSGTKAALLSQIKGIKTAGSDEFRLAMLYKEAAALEHRINEKLTAQLAEAKQALADEVMDHRGTKHLLTEREAGLEMIQRIAEAAGLVKSDREDVLDTYRR